MGYLWKAHLTFGIGVAQITSARSLRFGEEPTSRLHKLLEMLSIAMEEERLPRYDDAEKLKREQQLDSMRLQLSLAVCPSGNRLLSCKSVISSDDLVFVPTTPQKYRRRPQERSLEPPEEDEGGGDFLGKVHLLLAGNPPDVLAAGRIVHEMIAHAGSDDYSEGEVGLELSDACSQKVVKCARMELKSVCSGRVSGPSWRDDLLRIIALWDLSAELDGDDSEDEDLISDFLQAQLENLSVSCYRRMFKRQTPTIQSSQDLLKAINTISKEDIDVPGALNGLEDVLYFVLDFMQLFLKNAKNSNQSLLTNLVARGASVSSRICYSLFISLLLGLSLTSILHACKVLKQEEDGSDDGEIANKAQVKTELNKAFKVIETFEERMVEMLGSESERFDSSFLSDEFAEVVKCSFEVFDSLEAEEA
ncbi:hypothetical protein GUITHDRAFT_138046 [Guillardia theta CCMP2712]|uniref:Uncharacterized protein n=1 Tax=Guillardia theta (strain CCMP2712) TaxID=905079 RepID=L1JEY6_GUITC|nr:hypothetical protein GUITHDRAFT_138046 [Guillardia theta CCMP2712]EKX46665.1 hypothetical protein GUITHDRAFT_138046 [Guillardia theta CCMP2712]|eukprot:XP_005833645.1 hypothetical protein GUITHDRAFT_138046 [Guillardia theta CCMP2712]